MASRFLLLNLRFSCLSVGNVSRCLEVRDEVELMKMDEVGQAILGSKLGISVVKLFQIFYR